MGRVCSRLLDRSRVLVERVITNCGPAWAEGEVEKMDENPNLHYHRRGLGYTYCTDSSCTRPRVEERPLRVPPWLVPPWLVKTASGIFITALVVGGLVFLNNLPGLWHDLENWQQISSLCRQQQPPSDTILQWLDRVKECLKIVSELVRNGRTHR